MSQRMSLGCYLNSWIAEPADFVEDVGLEYLILDETPIHWGNSSSRELITPDIVNASYMNDFGDVNVTIDA